MARNINGYDTHASSSSGYDRDTFNAKHSPDAASQSKDTNTSNDSHFIAQPMTITITEPQKESEGSSGTYISYLITTHVCTMESFNLRSATGVYLTDVTCYRLVSQHSARDLHVVCDGGIKISFGCTTH